MVGNSQSEFNVKIHTFSPRNSKSHFARGSIARFGSKRCFCTLELATSTIEAEGVFLCGSVTRARSHLQFHDKIW